jgi:hypothetical protein
MKPTLPLLTSAALLFGATALMPSKIQAASEHAPGQQAEPGATAGKTMDSDPSPDAPGASDYAPGKQANPAATGGKTKDSDPSPH